MFANNVVSDHGGAVYASIELDLPCFLAFKLLSYSSYVIFQGNVAKCGICMDVYGASIRSNTCEERAKQTLSPSYCGSDWKRVRVGDDNNQLSSSLSSVSSDPKRVCLYDSNGYPQCAVLSTIFANGPRVLTSHW